MGAIFLDIPQSSWPDAGERQFWHSPPTLAAPLPLPGTPLQMVSPACLPHLAPHQSSSSPAAPAGHTCLGLALPTQMTTSLLHPMGSPTWISAPPKRPLLWGRWDGVGPIHPPTHLQQRLGLLG